MKKRIEGKTRYMPFNVKFQRVVICILTRMYY